MFLSCSQLCWVECACGRVKGWREGEGGSDRTEMNHLCVVWGREPPNLPKTCNRGEWVREWLACVWDVREIQLTDWLSCHAMCWCACACHVLCFLCKNNTTSRSVRVSARHGGLSVQHFPAKLASASQPAIIDRYRGKWKIKKLFRIHHPLTDNRISPSKRCHYPSCPSGQREISA